jgi:hypothetical protein
MEYWAAISIGLLGSLHCVGMCGPIALALPLDRSNSFQIFAGSSLYNIGRLATYFTIGCFFGIIGSGFAMAGFQQKLSIAVGIFMILSALWAFFHFKKWNIPVHFLWINKVKSAMAKRFGRTSLSNLFLIGMLNGLLPCGLVYMGLAGAVAMASPIEGGFFMACFGLGTLPLMLSVAVYGNKIKRSFLPSVKRFVPLFLFLLGTLFILRGMNLGIPYVSPQLQNSTLNCQ